jgi:hypothetical protein
MSAAIHLSVCRPRFLPRGQKIGVSQPRLGSPSVGSVWLNQFFSSFHHQKYIHPDLHIQCRTSTIAVTSIFSATRGNSKHIA